MTTALARARAATPHPAVGADVAVRTYDGPLSGTYVGLSGVETYGGQVLLVVALVGGQRTLVATDQVTATDRPVCHFPVATGVGACGTRLGPHHLGGSAPALLADPSPCATCFAHVHARQASR